MESTFDTGLGKSGRKMTIFGIIVAFHFLLVWALMSSLGTIIVDRLPPIIKAEIIEEIQKDDEPPPPPPTIETPPPYVPPPDILIDLPVDVPVANTALSTTNKPAPVAAPPTAATGIRIAPKIDKRFEGRLRPDYPPTSRRLGEEGLVVLECLVNVEGKCEEVKLKTSSTFPRLDEAALKHAPRAWRFTPGTEDGKPVPLWVTVPIRFRIAD